MDRSRSAEHFSPVRRPHRRRSVHGADDHRGFERLRARHRNGATHGDAVGHDEARVRMVYGERRRSVPRTLHHRKNVSEATMQQVDAGFATSSPTVLAPPGCSRTIATRSRMAKALLGERSTAIRSATSGGRAAASAEAGADGVPPPRGGGPSAAAPHRYTGTPSRASASVGWRCATGQSKSGATARCLSFRSCLSPGRQQMADLFPA